MPSDIVAGTFRSADQITRALRDASERFHLVSAGTSTAVPEGVAVAFSPILVDLKSETYKIPGSFGADAKYGLAKSALDRIAAAAGISWDVHETRRIDDGSHPYFVHYQAVGILRDFDGSERRYKAEKVLDMREGSAELENFVDVSAAKIAKESNRDKRDARVRAEAREKAEGQIRAVRAHIIGHAESKAKNRVVRALGVRTSYSEAELAKPFVVARPVYTGESSDPEIARENAAAIRGAFLGARASLYGAAPALPSTAPGTIVASPGAPAPRRQPPIDVKPLEDSGEYGLGDDDDEQQAPEKAPEKREERREAAPKGNDSGPRARETFQFGNLQGDPIVEADDDQIAWYVNALEKSVANPEKERFRAQNQADLEFCRRVLAKRSGEDAGY